MTAQKIRLEILKKIHKQSSEYFKTKYIQKQRAANIISLNEYYKREVERNKK